MKCFKLKNKNLKRLTIAFHVNEITKRRLRTVTL